MDGQNPKPEPQTGTLKYLAFHFADWEAPGCGSMLRSHGYLWTSALFDESKAANFMSRINYTPLPVLATLLRVASETYN